MQGAIFYMHFQNAGPPISPVHARHYTAILALVNVTLMYKPHKRSHEPLARGKRREFGLEFKPVGSRASTLQNVRYLQDVRGRIFYLIQVYGCS